ncbi:MAG: D-Ala-D-Ala carboxypeptidase family metallohydrolase [Bacteroidota bacterium]
MAVLILQDSPTMLDGQRHSHMMRKFFTWKWVKRILLIGIGLSLLASVYVRWIFDPLLGPIYDRLSRQKAVHTSEQLDQTLEALPTLSYKRLVRTDLARGDGLSSMKHYQDQEFIRISGVNRYRYLVGNQRVHQFLPGMRIWRFRLPRLGHTQYLLIDKRVLRQLLSFRQALEKQGLNPNAFAVSSGFRPPSYNKRVGGKPKSRHLHGQAIDILIQDLNSDGRSNQTDVDLAYKILHEQIVTDKGGLGRYNSNKRLLHLDCRGYRARWHY